MIDRHAARPRRRTAFRLSAALGLVLAASAVACKPDPPGARPGATEIAGPPLALAFASDAGGGAQAPAYALTASDGTGMRLAFLDARVVVQGPLALTQLRLAFDNWSERTFEGRFEVTMPEGATISRFAMKIGDAWQEGEVVERLKASQIYESFLHRRVDPALLEHDAGNRFRARVFPILGRSRKELIISYTQELADPREPYRLPLLGLPHLDALYVQVFVSGADDDGEGRVLRLNRFDHVPEGDLVLREAPQRRSAGVRHGSIVAARVELAAEPSAAMATTKDRVAGWTLLLDTSASQAAGFAARARRLKPLIAALAAREGSDVHVEVIGFDQERVSLYRGPSSGFGDAHIDGVIARGALGASDLEAALREATRVVRPGSRVLLLSDGIATAGATAAGALSAAAADVRAAGVTRIDAIDAGHTRDAAALRAVTTPRPGAASSGAVIDGEESTQVLVGRLFAPMLEGVTISVPGSRWVWPHRLDGVQPGDSVLVYAELDERAPLRVEFGAAPLLAREVATETVERPLIERAWRGAQMRELLARHEGLAADDLQRVALREQIVDHSIAHRLLTPFTAMLVLETEGDYLRFRLHRRALSDILMVGDAGLKVLRRDLATALERAREATAERAGSPGRPGPLIEPDPQVPAPPRPAGEDSDGDGIPDVVDACPSSPEDFDGMEDEDGCPDLFRIDNCQIKLSPKVHFAPRSADLSPKMFLALDEVVETMNAAPEIALWVEGHADAIERGPDRLSKQLSQRRVDAVLDYLVKAGIDPARLEPIGWGEAKPTDDNRTAAGRANNRRVEFNLRDCSRGIDGWSWHARGPALEGRFLAVDEALRRSPAEALKLARKWWSEQPADVLAVLALGRALAAVGQLSAAARAFGSLIDLSPSRAELRRHAGQRLEALGAIELAVDSYRQAARLRPDHPSSHRLLALALARLGRHAEAFAAAKVGLEQEYPPGRFPGVHELLREDLAILGAAWIRAEPAAAPEVMRQLAALGLAVAAAPSLRFVASWETDAADVDLHILDAKGHHAHLHGRGAGRLMHVNNTAGFGPEPSILGGTARAYPYTVNVVYTSRGAMGSAMGAVQVLEHDGHGRLGFATLPFVLMREGAGLDIGVVAGPLLAAAPE